LNLNHFDHGDLLIDMGIRGSYYVTILQIVVMYDSAWCILVCGEGLTWVVNMGLLSDETTNRNMRKGTCAQVLHHDLVVLKENTLLGT